MKNKKMWIVLIVSYFIIIVIFSNEMRADIISKKYSNLNYLGEVGTWVYFGDDILGTIQELIPLNRKKAKNNIEQFVENRQLIPYEFGECIEAQNIVLIQLEGVDAISLDLQYEGQYVMPNLNKLKESSLYFSSAYDQSGSGRTSDGEFLATTSLLPVANESMYMSYQLDSVVSLPRVLSDHGYKTISIHGFEGAFYNRRNVHKTLGYQESYFLEELENEATDADYLGWGLSDEFVLNKTYELIKNMDEKVFVHTILLSNHHPFDAVTDACNELVVKNPQNIVENYLNSIRYTDTMIGELIDQLQGIGELDSTLLVIYSDHDSGITDQIFEYFNLEYDIAQNWQYDMIPLLFYYGKAGKGETMIAGQAEIMPVILSYLDIEIPKSCMGLNYIDGKKVVYKQMKNIYDDGVIGANLSNMDMVTKSFLEYQETY